MKDHPPLLAARQKDDRKFAESGFRFYNHGTGPGPVIENQRRQGQEEVQ